MKPIFLLLLTIISLDISAQKDSAAARKDTLNGATQNVTVKAAVPLIQYQTDKTVINVAANMNAQGTNIFEVLQRSPGLSITGQDELVMNGKQGLNVLIDGRPTQLTGRDLAAYLKSLPAETVEKIELIANPSARYDAQGNAGIINIRMKRNKAFGTNGSINGSYTQNVHYRTTGGLSINHRQKNLNLFGNYSINNSYQYVKVITNRLVQSTQGVQTFATRQVEQDRYTSQNMRLGADVTFSKRSILGVLYTRSQINNPTFTPGTTTIGNGRADSILQVAGNYRLGSLRQNANLNYRFEDTSGNTLNVDADYTRFGSNTDNPVQNELFAPGGALLHSQTISNGLLNGIDVYSLKADYYHPVKKWNAEVEAGAKATVARTNNDFDARQLQSGFWKQDTGLSNHFIYNEKVLAGYGTWQGSVKSWQYKLGLRAEYTAIQGAASSLRGQTDHAPDTAYFSLFPSAYISYAFAKGIQQLKIAYSRRIGRPAYQDLNPFEKRIDQYNIEKGNPALRPAFTDNLELGLVFKNDRSITLGYSRTANISETGVYAQGNILYLLPQNTGTQNNTYLSINAPVTITGWWNTFSDATLFYNHYKAALPQGYLNAGAIGMNLYNQQDFTAGKGWKFSTEYWGYLPGRQGILKGKYLGSLSLGVEKKLLKNRAAIRFHFYDVFRTQRWAQTVDFGNVTGDTERRWEGRGVRLSCSLSFGGSGVKGSRERSTGNDERIKEKQTN